MTQEKKLKENPEEQESEVLDFTKPDYKFIPKSYHDWVQRGPYLVCRSCDLDHGVWIGMDKILTGIDDKGPILKNRKDLGMV